MSSNKPNNPEDLFFSKFEEEQKVKSTSKESMISFLLIALTLSCMIIGLFTLKQNHSASEKEGGKFVSNLIGDRVAVIGLEGVIFDSFYYKSPFASRLDAANAKRELLNAIEDKGVKGVMFRVNSPGGTVGASQEIFELVEQVKDAGKPVVISMGDVCASGCYYIASAADKIVANPGTLTGSIGVISQGLNFTGLLEKLGLSNQTFTAGKFKDAGSPYRPMTAEEKKIMQDLLDDSYNQFLADVAEGRNIPLEEVSKIAEGLIYTGKQAVGKKLVDVVGSYEEAKELMRELLEDEYDYKKAKSIDFEETWNVRRLSPFEDLFDFYMPESMIRFAQEALGLDKAARHDNKPISFSKYQPLWLMP